MGLRDRFEEYRREQAQRLKHDKLRIDEEAKKLEAQKLQIKQGEFRLNDDPPADNACPACFFHGRPPAVLEAVPSDTPEDRFKCEACGFEA